MRWYMFQLGESTGAEIKALREENEVLKQQLEGQEGKLKEVGTLQYTYRIHSNRSTGAYYESTTCLYLIPSSA